MKAVIVAAGYGTRFLPVTRVVPKELLPIVDRPALALVVDELTAAGVDSILVITSRRKKALEDWFDRDPELEAVVGTRAEPPHVKVAFVRQQRMTGTGDALLLAREFAGDEPVVVAYPDDLFAQNATAACWATAMHTGCSVLSAQELPADEDPARYGILDVEVRDGGLGLRRIVEKPPKGTEPSRLASWGRYVFQPEFFRRLAELRPAEHRGEYFHIPAIQALASERKVAVEVISGMRYDTGTPQGYLRTVIALALERPDVGPDLRRWLKTLP
jgi:UTP--glucose-1-phosphate uridylyltransferase